MALPIKLRMYRPLQTNNSTLRKSIGDTPKNVHGCIVYNSQKGDGGLNIYGRINYSIFTYQNTTQQ